MAANKKPAKPKKPSFSLGDPRVKDPATRAALGYPDAYGQWNKESTKYTPRPGVKIGFKGPEKKTKPKKKK